MSKFAVFTVALAGLCVASTVALADLNEVYSWKDVSFKWPSEEAKNRAIGDGQYIAENNLPLGLARWKDKLFVTVPRWKAGVAATLNYIPLNETDPSPALIPYPNWESNQLPKVNESAGENTIVSIFRMDVDVCDRLWILDTGLAEILGEGRQITPPTVLVFDLKTDKLILRYPLKPEDVAHGSFFANIVTDVTSDKCDQAYAYIPDLGGNALVVYSLANNDSWRIRHHYFHFDPLKGNLEIGGIQFQWNDGLFGIALGPVESDGFRTAYFHPFISDCEFSVNTRIWKNKTLALEPASYHKYKFEGNKGEKSQTSASSYDQKTNVVFLSMIQKDGVGCWNTKKELSPNNVALVAQDHERILFPNDIKVDQERNLWILSDKLPFFFHGKLDHNQTNYRILRVPVDEAIKNTVCAP